MGARGLKEVHLRPVHHDKHGSAIIRVDTLLLILINQGSHDPSLILSGLLWQALIDRKRPRVFLTQGFYFSAVEKHGVVQELPQLISESPHIIGHCRVNGKQDWVE